MASVLHSIVTIACASRRWNRVMQLAQRGSYILYVDVYQCMFFSFQSMVNYCIVVCCRIYCCIIFSVMVNHVYSATLLDNSVVYLVFISISQAFAGQCVHDAFLFLRTTILGVGSNFSSHCCLVGCRLRWH